MSVGGMAPLIPIHRGALPAWALAVPLESLDPGAHPLEARDQESCPGCCTSSDLWPHTCPGDMGALFPPGLPWGPLASRPLSVSEVRGPAVLCWAHCLWPEGHLFLALPHIWQGTGDGPLANHTLDGFDGVTELEGHLACERAETPSRTCLKPQGVLGNTGPRPEQLKHRGHGLCLVLGSRGRAQPRRQVLWCCSPGRDL